MASPPPRRPEHLKPESRSWAEMQRGTNLGIWRMTRVPVLVLLGWFTLSHLTGKVGWVFVDNFNLLLHEAGHVFFSWDGEVLHILGGTIGQLMWPAFFAGFFWFKNRQLFATAACTWWFGENLMNIARYVDDAVAQDLPLVGGGEHDWTTLLERWNLLHRCHGYATTFRVFGVIIMLVGYAGMLWLTWRPRREEAEAPPPD